MWWKQVLAVVLIAAGTLGLVYGKFTYTTETHEARIAGIEVSLKEKKTLEIPGWAGIAAIAAGTVLLLVGSRR